MAVNLIKKYFRKGFNDQLKYHNILKGSYNVSTYVIGMALNISTKCQHKCERCFGHLSNYNGDEFMDFTTAIKATEYLLKMIKTQPCHINIYGGEPLLNWDMLKEYIHWFASLKIDRTSLSTETNGIALNEEIINYHIEHRTNLCISLDGPYEFHSNKVSKTEFNHIINMIQYGVKKNHEHISIHCVVKKNNITNLDRILSFIISLGVKNINIGRDLREIWTDFDRFQIIEILKRIAVNFDGIIRPLTEGTFDCTSCKSIALMFYPNGDVYDACYNFACTSTLNNINSQFNISNFFLGNLYKDINYSPDLVLTKNQLKENLKCYLINADIKETARLIYGKPNKRLFFPIQDFK